MLSYRHAFHAGNAADVLKHSLLVFCLDYLCQKDKPILYADTHAGAGAYTLAEGYATQNCEWEAGIAKICSAQAGGQRVITGHGAAVEQGRTTDLPLSAGLPAMLARYAALEAEGGGLYLGSPALARKCLRDQDRLVCFEMHPSDFDILRMALASGAAAAASAAPLGALPQEARQMEASPRGEARNTDGFDGLRSLLPPPSRRACVLIDPPYEMPDDYEKVSAMMRDAFKRFSTGIYIVWYPLLRKDNRGEMLRDRLMDAYQGGRCFVELCTGERARPAAPYITPTDSAQRGGPARAGGQSGTVQTKRGGLYGSGLAVFNPPWALKVALEEALPFLANLLGGAFGSWRLVYPQVKPPQNATSP